SGTARRAAVHADKRSRHPCLARGARHCFQLGFDHERGRNGRARDMRLALRLYRIACRRGVAGACTNLGHFHSQGLAGLQRDPREALRLYRIGCDAGSELGCSNLGVLYERGRAVKRDYAQARRYYRVACDRGVGLACANLGGLYRYGRGVKHDRRRALDLYRLACDRKLGKGCRYAGWMIARGDTAKADLAQALALFRRGCRHGDKAACKTATRIAGVDKLAARALGGAKNAAKGACTLGGLWQPGGGVLWTSGRSHFPVGTLRWTPSLFARVRFDRKGEARAVLDGGSARVHGEISSDGAGPKLYLATLTRAASGVLWLDRGYALRVEGARHGKLRVRPRLASSVFDATALRTLALPCASVTLAPGLPGPRAAAWPDGGAPGERGRLDARDKAVAVYEKPGGRRVGSFRVSKYRLGVRRLQTRRGFSQVRYRAYRYAVVGWVRDKALSISRPAMSNVLGALSGSGGFGIGGLVGRLGSGTKASEQRQCSRDVVLFAQQGQQVAPLGELRKGTPITVAASEVKGYSMVRFTMRWLRRERGVAFVVRDRDLAAYCREKAPAPDRIRSR
ncbi:MAG: sel1 repeat family protein, partial [Myxococcales bacterium]|nr:sel1 repeat family protein [Myxococcales bacterium]